jgi:hypothetical protein
VEPDIEAVRTRHVDALMRLPNVNGVGIGERDGKPVIQVLVARKAPLDELGAGEVVPQTLDGFQTDVVEVGELSAQ